ncbi:hypothetical protein NM208_g10946 [Fusarium decemcellulare]|uniref:Uncharacterized protein n=1 Tax=Fusarium decemcellulare TaxID=57161 RepID=A0ACC1RW30_9HYPO|nr:hypothetical protein NM208_g10946 [Fusarium decemcellulare]
MSDAPGWPNRALPAPAGLQGGAGEINQAYQDAQERLQALAQRQMLHENHAKAMKAVIDSLIQEIQIGDMMIHGAQNTNIQAWLQAQNFISALGYEAKELEIKFASLKNTDEQLQQQHQGLVSLASQPGLGAFNGNADDLAASAAAFSLLFRQKQIQDIQNVFVRFKQCINIFSQLYDLEAKLLKEQSA